MCVNRKSPHPSLGQFRIQKKYKVEMIKSGGVVIMGGFMQTLNTRSFFLPYF